MGTYVITGKEVQKILTPSVAIAAVKIAFRAYGTGGADMPPKSYLFFKKGDLRTMPAYIHGQGLHMAGVKSVNVHPENMKHKLPSVMAMITLHDPKDGYPLAVMDGTYLTALRTGAAGAVAAQLLCRRSSGVVGFVGCGSQARTQLSCLREVMNIESIKAWKWAPKDKTAEHFCRWAEEMCGVKASIFSKIDEVSTDVDVLVTTTPSRKPLVSRISPGTHINAIGADAMGKQEISPRIMKQAKILVDDWVQASHSGEINVPLNKRQISRKHIFGELAEVVTGKKEGRASDAEITVFDSTGLAIQDIACAAMIYKAVKKEGRLKTVDFF
ncbi:MAG: ornithine cyclodeaminase family protein [Thermodesulfobacteriota bacterium]|nr:ornithine cyclodeaminase family protein [Thermodesulfobacteriota bacterium]